MNKVLVVAVHPDDETLGAGGTLMKYRDNGDEIYWLIVTAMYEKDGFDKVLIESRKKEIEDVKEKFLFKKVTQLDLPSSNLDQISEKEIIEKLSEVIKDIEPNIIMLPFRGDVHSDHRIVFEAASSCTKSFRYPFIKRVLMMETISETEFAPSLSENAFVPNYFVDISKHFDQKLEVMNIYKSEMKEHPFPRSVDNIKALATFRGSMAQCQYAESFMVLKDIW